MEPDDEVTAHLGIMLGSVVGALLASGMPEDQILEGVRTAIAVRARISGRDDPRLERLGDLMTSTVMDVLESE